MRLILDGDSSDATVRLTLERRAGVPTLVAYRDDVGDEDGIKILSFNSGNGSIFIERTINTKHNLARYGFIVESNGGADKSQRVVYSR